MPTSKTKAREPCFYLDKAVLSMDKKLLYSSCVYQMGLLSSSSAELLAYFLKCVSSFNSKGEMSVRDYRLMEK